MRFPHLFAFLYSCADELVEEAAGMMELLFLLLPLAAISGWYSGRRSRQRERQDCHFDQAYFEGINLLLNEQPDKAVDHFIEMLEVNTDTVETHLALGGLFRRRGEVDRAIRIHQNLIARPSLSREQRAQALLELGRDHMKAGLYDRAIGLFEELLEQRLYRLQALQHLHQIYQKTRDWDNALTTAARLESLGEASLRLERAHYYCELAQQALTDNDEHQAGRLLKKALSTDKQSVRASLLLGELAQRHGNHKEAIRHYSAVEGQDASFFGEVLTPLAACYRATGQDQLLIDTLKRAVREFGNTDALIMLVEHLDKIEGRDAAREVIAGFLDQRPSLKALRQLLQLHQVGGDLEELMRVLRQALDRMIDDQFPYHCSHCGFTARQLHWQCPSCTHWGDLRPVANADNFHKEARNGFLVDLV